YAPVAGATHWPPMKFLKVSVMRGQRGVGVTSGQIQTAVARAPTRGSTSRVSNRIPQMINSCEMTCAAPSRRFQEEMLDHNPAAITVVTAARYKIRCRPQPWV